jgi:DNA excision repair protein ERCC-6
MSSPNATEPAALHDSTVDSPTTSAPIVNMSTAPADRLANLTTASAEQDELERAVADQAERLLKEQARERDVKRLERTQNRKDRLQARLRTIARKLEQPGSSREKNPLREERGELEAEIRLLDGELVGIQARMEERENASGGEEEVSAKGRFKGESQRDFLIRTGKITPFSRGATSAVSADLGDVMIAAEEEDDLARGGESENEASQGPLSHRVLLKPGGFGGDDTGTESATSSVMSRKRKSRRDEYASEGEFVESSMEESSDFASSYDSETGVKRKRSKKKPKVHGSNDMENLAELDDGNEKLYQARLKKWSNKRREAREKRTGMEQDSDSPEWLQPHPSREDAIFSYADTELKMPGDVYPSLFDYQKTGVKWLWELYMQRVGGIIGDEMGLGKTIQIISFLAGLHHSGKLNGPVIVVCPATVMKQWVNEFHRWWPPLRVSILHSSGSGMMNLRSESAREDELEVEEFGAYSVSGSRKSHSSASKIVDRVLRHGHVLVTTYSGLQTYSELLLDVQWHYAVLDEGHKIRNPNTAITMHCKELRTHNRIILSGTPMQNNLTELWSLFDFCCPLRLGTLVLFRQRFDLPIKLGGYANATNLQVETAMKCAETLKDAIGPYLLQRFKVDVATDLPKKTERVLFCKLTDLQRQQYQKFLSGEEMSSIIAGKRQPLFGVDILRKLCNHPDLVDHRNLSKKPGYNYGEETKSGKMQVVRALLELWQQDGHKTLLFAQHRIMLDILEKFIRGMDGFRYLRMDGNTSIKDRQDLVNRFNNDPNLHVFLLTTKVGGLGVNLTGADRVIIYDPDWNPSTDVQARERAWRLGQKKEVEIYRLMTAGTIEEKIYHRQIFKQFLTNKILRDPKQRQTFHLSDLHDLFSLGDVSDTTETGTLFRGTEVTFGKQKQKEKKSRAATIAPIVRQEEFHDSAPEASNGNEPVAPGETNKPERVLSAIFSRSGVHSALEHDAIINTNTTTTKSSGWSGPDPEVIAREARKVADRAARELKESAELAKTMPAGVPTWTGTFGIGGFQEDQNRLGRRAGAGAVLANAAITEQQRRNQRPSQTNSSVNLHNPRGKDFMVLIRDFLISHGGYCYTQNLIDHFNRFCGTPQRTAEFKEMLSRIAVLEKGGRGRSKWYLKKEFGGTK